MKIKDILTENLDLESNELYKMAIADPYGAAGSDLDRYMNPEAHFFAEEERKKVEKRGFTPVYAKPAKDSEDRKTSTMPGEEKMQSPGFKGREKVKQRAGIPHFPYDSVVPDYKPVRKTV